MGASHSKKAASAKHVVIVGGGVGGTGMARVAADAGFQVTLIERVSGSYVKYAGPRSIIDPEFAATKALVSNDKLLAGRHARSRRVQAEVLGVDTAAKLVRLANGETIAYDHVVVAVGARNLSPAQLPVGATTAAEIKAYFARVRDAIVAAKAVVVVGGGAVGTETAGSVRLANPGCAITLVHSGAAFLAEQQLASTTPSKAAAFQKELERALRAASVDVRLGARVVGLRASDCPDGYAVGARSLALSTGGAIDADLVLWCVGNASAATGLIDASFLDASGQIKVDRTGRILGVADSSAFAIGDCCNLSTNKVALAGSNVGKPGFQPKGHADIVCRNLLELAQGRPGKHEYPLHVAYPMIVSLGGKLGGAALGAPKMMVGLKSGYFEHFVIAIRGSARAS